MEHKTLRNHSVRRPAGRRRGMTLMEIMIVVIIIALLVIAGMINIKKQIDRGYDARRKDDLAKIKAALEDYYNDNESYPDNDTWNAMNCKTGAGMDFLKPHLDGKPIPCDPQTNTPYLYQANTGGCDGYVLLAALKDTGDKDITSLGCSGLSGCGYLAGYNFGSGTGSCTVPAPGFDASLPPVPTPLPGVTPGNYGCSADGSGTEGCQDIGKHSLDVAGCPSFSTTYCDHLCGSHPEYRYGHCK